MFMWVIRSYFWNKVILIGATNTFNIIKSKENLVEKVEDHPGQANKGKQGEQKRKHIGRKKME
jgi:hypothetical protein